VFFGESTIILKWNLDKVKRSLKLTLLQKGFLGAGKKVFLGAGAAPIPVSRS
jgi:hypothetical protein